MSAQSFHPISSKIETLLVDHNMWHERFEHAPVRTSEEAAALRPDYTLAQGAKALIVRIKIPHEGKKFVMVVVPGDEKFDVGLVKAATGANDLRFATEEEVGEITNGVKPGGVPPFGNLFGLPVYADENIFDYEKIIFNAGDRSVSIGMRSEDYKTLVAPHVHNLAR